MLDAGLQLVNEEFFADLVPPDRMDDLWARGWRHFGTHFFRYSVALYEFDLRRVTPLRIKLADFSFSKSQRRILRRNVGLRTVIRPVEITPETEELFERHKRRFKDGVPDSIYNFLSDENPAASPCEALEINVCAEQKLVAASYFDVGATAVSGIYGMFEPEETRLSLGIFTLLKEIEFAVRRGMEFYYLGYSYDGNSFYDYKKRFRAIEAYDWKGNWAPFELE